MGEIEGRLHHRQAHHRQVHGLAEFQPLPQDGQQDQGDGQGIKEHQHGHAPGNDGGEAQVGDEHGGEDEADRPEAVARPGGKHLGEGFGAAGDEADGGFQAGHGHDGKEEQSAAAAEVMVSDDPQDLAAVFAVAAQGRALSGDDGQEQVDEAHEEAAEKSGSDSGSRHRVRFFHSGGFDGVHHDDAESQPRQSVKGVVPLEKASGESVARLKVFAGRLRRRQRRNGLEQGGDDEAEQQSQKQGIQVFADPGHQPPGMTGNDEDGGEEQQGENRQSNGGINPVPKGYRPDGEGGAGAAGDGEQGPDGQVEEQTEQEAELPADLRPDLQHAAGFRDAQGGHRQQGQPHRRQEHSPEGPEDIMPGGNAQRSGEDHIPRAEEHPEEHTGDHHGFLYRQIPFQSITFGL